MRSQRKVFLLITASVLLGLGCNLLSLVRGGVRDAPEGDPEPTATPVLAGDRSSPGVLQPGENVVGSGGVVIQAEPGAIQTPLAVWIEPAEDPGAEGGIPAGASAVGGDYRVGSQTGTYAATGTSYEVGLPVPEGVNPETLWMGVHEPGEGLFAETYCEDEECPDEIVYEDTWVMLPGRYDQDRQLFFADLGLLSPDGRILSLFSLPAEEGQSRHPGKGALAAPLGQDGAQFEANCIGFADSGVTCDDSVRTAVESEMADAYANFTIDLGFSDPYLQQDADGAYQINLRPIYTSTDDNDRVGRCEKEGSITNYGKYFGDSKTIIVCIPSGGVTSSVLRTAFHEYFHATQLGYSGVRGSWRYWVLEGTASASENSVDAMMRDTGRGLHDADVPLNSAKGLTDYQSQDFWVYLGRRWNLGLDYLTDLFERGAGTTDVDETLQQDWPGSLTLADAYWDWIRNQTFEKTVDLGGGVLGDACEIATGTGEPMRIDYNFGFPPGPQSIQLEPLNSVILEINFQPLSLADYVASFEITPTASPDIRSKVYPDVSGTTDCQRTAASQYQQVTVAAGQDETYYALVSNTSLNNTLSFQVSFTPTQSELQILEPRDGYSVVEGEAIEFLALAGGLAGGSGNTGLLHWYYKDYRGTQISLGSSENGEYHIVDHLCDGTYQVTAEAINASTSEVLTDSVQVTVTDLGDRNPPDHCAPEVSIVSPGSGATYRVGDTIQLRAEIDDDHPETDDPLFPIIWHANSIGGRIIGRGLNASTKLDPGTTAIYVEYGAASDSRELEIIETENTPPTGTTILEPDDGAEYHYNDPGAGFNGITVDFLGEANDTEDGALTGDSLDWSYRVVGTSEWIEMGTGTEASHEFRYTSGWEHYEIRLQARDSEGLMGPASIDIIQISVQGPPS